MVWTQWKNIVYNKEVIRTLGYEKGIPSKELIIEHLHDKFYIAKE